jgi:hypothetical protein
MKTVSRNLITGGWFIRVRKKVIKMVQKLVLRNEIVKVRGRVKVITIKKDEFEKFLQLRKLIILDKEYEALMPPLNELQKNTIDVNGLATLVQQYITAVIFGGGNQSQSTPAQMVLTTSGGNITLSYTGNISLNSQGVTVYMQVLEDNNNWTFQYYYVGFDTTNSSYSTSQLELYVSAYQFNNYSGCGGSQFYLYTNAVRIAYANTSFTKSSDSYLFIVWLIEFQNIPPYLVYFTPILQNNVNITLKKCCGGPSLNSVYFNNGSCDFTCGGNCPSTGLGSFIIYVQNNAVVVEFPLTAPLGTGISSLEVLFCANTAMLNMPTISGNTSSTLTPPVSGATFYVAIATITVTYQGS